MASTASAIPDTRKSGCWADATTISITIGIAMRNPAMYMAVQMTASTP
jgi:hypothetical protein